MVTFQTERELEVELPAKLPGEQQAFWLDRYFQGVAAEMSPEQAQERANWEVEQHQVLVEREKLEGAELAP